MHKIFLFFSMCLLPTALLADDVILMIGDGMGMNHLKCAAQSKPLYLTSLPVKGYVHTYSANNSITDSAASATAYSCGQKTNNSYLGKLSNTENCETIAEEGVRKGLSIGIYSNDNETGATPSAFYAHTTNRDDKQTIKADMEKAKSIMDIVTGVKKISNEITPRLDKLSSDKKGFFAMFEGAKIDKRAHDNKLEEMKKELYDFDYAVMKASNFVFKHPDTTLIVLADHETGGLTEDCHFTSTWHTGVDIPVYAYGKHAHLFDGIQENTDIYQKIKSILFSKDE